MAQAKSHKSQAADGAAAPAEELEGLGIGGLKVQVLDFGELEVQGLGTWGLGFRI